MPVTTRIVTADETQRLRQELAGNGLATVEALLQDARLAIVDAPEIGCMPILREHLCQIDVPPAQYERLNALPSEDKERLLQVMKKVFEADDPELSLIEVDFRRRG